MKISEKWQKEGDLEFNARTFRASKTLKSDYQLDLTRKSMLFDRLTNETNFISYFLYVTNLQQYQYQNLIKRFESISK